MRSILDSRYLVSGFRRKSQIKNQEYESGMSLIAVMWIVTILTVLASEFLYSMQLEIRIARNWSDQMDAFYSAKGGLESAISMLRDDETEYDSLDEDWAVEITGQLNNSTYATAVIDESAKININTADEETLTKAIAYIVNASSDESMTSEEEATAEAQTLATAIIEKRPYRTVAEMAKAENMTPEILYGKLINESGVEIEVAAADEASVQDEEEQPSSLVEITTVYSADKNVTSDGQRRVNINSADSSQIQQGINPEGQEIITEQEAQAIVSYRDEQGNNQGGEPGQGGEPNQGGTPDQGEGADQQEAFSGIAQLLDVPAISQETLDSIRERITVEDEGDEGGEREDGEEPRININTASADELQSLDGIDSGIADSIVRHRQQNQFGNVDELRDVKLVSIDDMKTIVDRITISDDEVLQGKVNINTAPLDILQMLPGMDEEKAQAIAARREVEEQGSSLTVSQQGNQETGPFTSLGQLLDVEGIDEQTFRNLIDHVTYRSHVYMINSEGRSPDGKIVQNCIAIVDRTGDSIKFKYWKQE